VTEQNDCLVGEVEIGFLQIGEAHDGRSLQRAHRLLGVFAHIQENVLIGFVPIVGCEELFGFLRADPQRMLQLLREIDLLGIRIVWKACWRARRPQQRILKTRLPFVGLLNVLPDVDADRDAHQGEQANRGVDEAARCCCRAASPARLQGTKAAPPPRTVAKDWRTIRPPVPEKESRELVPYRAGRAPACQT
jgi:hypothetical protein